MADQKEIPGDIRDDSFLVTCQSSKTLHYISEAIRTKLQKTIDGDVSLSDEQKEQIKERFWLTFLSAIQENTVVDCEKWTVGRSDELDFCPVDKTLVQRLNTDLPQRMNEAITNLAQKRKTLPGITGSLYAKRLKLRRRYLEHVPCEVTKGKEIGQPIQKDDPLFDQNRSSCRALADLVKKTSTTSEESESIRFLFESEIETRRYKQNVTSSRRGTSARTRKNFSKKQQNNENQNLLKNLPTTLPCTSDGRVARVEISLRRKNSKS